MSVLIKDMEMPKSCKECPLKLGSPDGVTCLVKDWWWTFDYTRPDWCPIEEFDEEED